MHCKPFGQIPHFLRAYCAIIGVGTFGCSSDNDDAAPSAPTPDAPTASSSPILVTVPYSFDGNEPVPVHAALVDGRIMIDDMILGWASDFGLDPKTGQPMNNKGAVCNGGSCVGLQMVWHDCDGIDYCFADGASCTSNSQCATATGGFTCDLTKQKCVFSSAQKTEIANAFGAWRTAALAVSSSTNIKFNQKSSCAGLGASSIYVHPITDPNANSCSAPLGANWLVNNDINLPPGCVNQGALRHEIGHSLGLLHEHQRPDRDSYVQVDFGAVGIDKWLNYFVLSAGYTTPYDSASVMHYGSWGFANGLQVPMISKKRWSLKKSQGLVSCLTSDDCFDSWVGALNTELTLENAQVGRFDANNTDDVFVIDAGKWKYSPSGSGSLVTLRTSTVTTVNVGSYDGDGKRDDVLEFSAGALKVYRNGNSGPTTILSGTAMNGVTFAQLLFGADLSNDGIDDIVRATGTDLQIAWSNGVNANGTPKPYSGFMSLTAESRPASQLAIGDFDADGFRDDLFASFSGAWRSRINLIDMWTTLYNDSTPVSELKFTQADISLATDVLKQVPASGGRSTPGLQMVFNPGIPYMEVAKPVAWNMPPVSSVLVGDFDGTNIFDILARGLLETHSATITTSDATAANTNVVCP